MNQANRGSPQAAAHAAQGRADEESVDMDERRDPPTRGGSHPPIPGDITLPTAQQAHIDYSGHAARCQRCRDIDRGRCDQGEILWRAWNRALEDAYRQLNPGRP